jgi:pilus assembly protein CpaF
MFSQPSLRSLESLLLESGVTDLVCNGCDSTQVLRGGRWQSAPNPFSSEEELADAARLLIGEGGRQLDQANPFANVTLHGRVRVHALLASAVNPKTHISLRVHGERPFGLEQLVQIGTLSADDYRNLAAIIQARESFLISGASGSGKTTLLRAMLMMTAHERVIAIEDVAELNIEAQTYVSLQTRTANVEGRGEINLQTLLTESLRMRPDRIVVGEIRGAELITLLQAINTGHASGATIHANSISEVSKRLLAIAHSAGLGEAALNALVRSSLNWLIHIDCIDAKRKVTLRKLAA